MANLADHVCSCAYCYAQQVRNWLPGAPHLGPLAPSPQHCTRPTQLCQIRSPSLPWLLGPSACREKMKREKLSLEDGLMMRSLVDFPGGLELHIGVGGGLGEAGRTCNGQAG